MLIKKSADIPSSEITPKSLYLNRRKFLAGTALAGAAAIAGFKFREFSSPSITAQANAKIDGRAVGRGVRGSEQRSGDAADTI